MNYENHDSSRQIFAVRNKVLKFNCFQIASGIVQGYLIVHYNSMNEVTVFQSVYKSKAFLENVLVLCNVMPTLGCFSL